MRYDQARMDELKTRETDLRARLTEIGKRMADRDEAGENAWTPAKNEAQARDKLSHSLAKEQLEVVMADMERMNRHRPQTRKERQSPLARFLRQGFAPGEDGLSPEEKRMFQDSDSARQAAAHYMGGDQGARYRSFVIPTDPAGRMEAFGVDREPRMAVRTDTAAGRTIVPTTILPSVDTLAYIGDGMAALARFQSSTANPENVPQFDDVDEEGEFVDQMGPVTNKDLGQPTIVQFTGRDRTSKRMNIPISSIRDLQFDIVTFTVNKGLRRLARGWNNVITTGTHATTPHGLVGTALNAAAGQAAAKNDAVTFDEMVNLRYKVERAYRSQMGEGVGAGQRLEGQGMIGYMISDSLERILVLQKDGDMRPLWLPSVREGVPATYNGYPMLVNGHMAATGAAGVPALFGNFASVGLRVIGSPVIYRSIGPSSLDTNSMAVFVFNAMDAKVRLPLGASDAGTGRVNKNPAVAALTLPS